MSNRGWNPLTCALAAAVVSPFAMAGGEFIELEPRPFQEATLRTTGETIMVPMHVKWKPFCGTNTEEMTEAEWQEILTTVKAGRDAAESATGSFKRSTIIDNYAGGGGGAGLNLQFNLSGSVPAAAITAIADCENIIENYFNDPVTIVISVDWQPLGALGATGSSATSTSYTNARNSLQSDMDGDDYIESFLPSGSTLPVRFNGASSAVTNEGTIDVNTATFEAAIGGIGGTDAFITISSTTSWDFDPSNGVPFSTFDFKSTFIHEVGHALGFTSAADGPSGRTEMLDLYRFQRTDGTGDFNPDNVTEFGTTPRLIDFGTPNDDHNSNLFEADGTDLEYRMADGNPNQASHFREQGAAIGIMDPTGAPGETFFPDYFQPSDLDMLDAIGWDFAPESATTPLPFSDSFDGPNIDGALWIGIDGATINGLGDNPPSGPNSLNLNFIDEVRSALMDTSAIDTVIVSYFWQRTGNSSSPEAGEDLVVEYRDSTGAWVELARYPGAGPDDDPFVQDTFNLTSADNATHSGFRLRFRVETSGGADNWFVDNVEVIGVNPPPNDACQFASLASVGANPFSSLNATSEGSTETCADFDSDVWYRVVTPCDGTLTVSVCDADFDAELAIYGVLCPLSPDQAIACNADACNGGNSISIPVSMNQLYRIRIGGAGGATGTGTLDISCGVVAAPACPWDCTPDNGDGTFGNGVVNIDDLLEVINSFGAAGGPCDSAPDNGDGTFGNNIINIDDLLAVINNFGACPS